MDLFLAHADPVFNTYFITFPVQKKKRYILTPELFLSYGEENKVMFATKTEA